MKKSISTVGIVTVVILFLAYSSMSCSKKKEEMHETAVTMTYSPNPALKDSLITVTFLVKDSDMPTNVTNYTCSYKLSTATNSTPLTLTQGATGTYSGTCTFNSVGMYNLSMMYMHGSDNMSKDFTLTVQ
ncbi:MAG: hypothetical protein HY951_01130 [Bacteroidia bacterium]|nr:hypothetical protein [Bacteroidia bacterium]